MGTLGEVDHVGGGSVVEEGSADNDKQTLLISEKNACLLILELVHFSPSLLFLVQLKLLSSSTFIIHLLYCLLTGLPISRISSPKHLQAATKMILLCHSSAQNSNMTPYLSSEEDKV